MAHCKFLNKSFVVLLGGNIRFLGNLDVCDFTCQFNVLFLA